MAGAHPFFAPAESQPARIEGFVPDEESPLDGQVRLFILPDEAVLLPVDVLNWPVAAPSLRQQAVVHARIAAFAESLDIWDSPEAYASTHPESRHQGLRWVVPTGLYPEDKGGTGRSTASMTGVVQAAAARVNGLTGVPFRWMRLETSGAVLDVVAADGLLPAPGAIVHGHFWLAGTVEPVAPDSLLRIAVG